MKSKEFKEIQTCLNATNVGFAELLNISVRAIEEWRSGRNSIPGPVAVLLKLLMKMKAEGRLDLKSIIKLHQCDKEYLEN